MESNFHPPGQMPKANIAGMKGPSTANSGGGIGGGVPLTSTLPTVSFCPAQNEAADHARESRPINSTHTMDEQIGLDGIEVSPGTKLNPASAEWKPIDAQYPAQYPAQLQAQVQSNDHAHQNGLYPNFAVVNGAPASGVSGLTVQSAMLQGSVPLNAVAANLQAQLASETQYQNHQNQTITPSSSQLPVVGQTQPLCQAAPPGREPGNAIQRQTFICSSNVHNGLISPVNGGTPSSAFFSPQPSEDGSSVQGATYLRTEPRNFAPRTQNSVTSEPPPRFDLQTPVQYNQQNNVISPAPSSSNDPFMGYDQFKPLPNIIQPIQAPVASTAMTLYNNAVPDHIRNLRSRQLNDLTAGPTGRPTPEEALHPDNFPFVESARTAQGDKYGVIKGVH